MNLSKNKRLWIILITASLFIGFYMFMKTIVSPVYIANRALLLENWYLEWENAGSPQGAALTELLERHAASAPDPSTNAFIVSGKSRLGIFEFRNELGVLAICEDGTLVWRYNDGDSKIIPNRVPRLKDRRE